MIRSECEQHHTPARDNQYRATARYYKDSCPYCEIDRLKALIKEQAHTIERLVSEAANTPELLKQLAEAEAEVERLKVIKWVQTESYEAVAAVQQARQEAARTIERHLLGMFWCIPSKENEPMIYRDQAIEWLRGAFKLEG